jgi:hypothetical protein
MRTLGPLVIIMSIAAAASAAHAAPSGLYLGIGVTKANVDNLFATNSGFNLDNTAWKAFVGFKPPVFPIGLEANYIDMGSETVGPVHADSKAFTGFAVGYLPLDTPVVDVYGKLGLARWQVNGSVPSQLPGVPLLALDSRGTKVAWGVGTQLHIANVAARLEFENFSISNSDGARLYSLGVSFYFL